MSKPSLLFVCTGNSARSQMAEGFARYYGGADVSVASAGTEPAGINEFAVWAMNEAGIDITHQSSTALDGVNGDFDYVITLCGDARDNCPNLTAREAVEHWALPDPAAVRGRPADRIKAFRTVRNEIETRVKALLTRIFEGD